MSSDDRVEQVGESRAVQCENIGFMNRLAAV
jgi:hypothetical protein